MRPMVFVKVILGTFTKLLRPEVAELMREKVDRDPFVSICLRLFLSVSEACG